jgi:hypothetical protein
MAKYKCIGSIKNVGFYDEFIRCVYFPCFEQLNEL